MGSVLGEDPPLRRQRTAEELHALMPARTAVSWQAAPALLQVLRERGIGVLPDVYANGGGVIVSFFEWVQNQQTYRWTARESTRATSMLRPQC